MATLFASDFGKLLPWWGYAISVVVAVALIAGFIYFIACITRDDGPQDNQDSN
jgi:hypothetical protein